MVVFAVFGAGCPPGVVCARLLSQAVSQPCYDNFKQEVHELGGNGVYMRLCNAVYADVLTVHIQCVSPFWRKGGF